MSGGWFYGITRGHSLKNVLLRMEQFRLARDPMVCLSLARQFVHGKIRNHRTLLMRNHLEPPEPTILKLKRASKDAPGRKRFFQMYEQRMSSLITHPLFDYKVSYRRALELQARLLAKALTGEIPEYVPLLTR